MDGDTKFTVALPSSLHDALADIARAEGRSPESVALDAIAEHCAAALELRAKVLRGDADLAAGRVVEHEEVMVGLQDIIARARQQQGA